MKKVSTTNVLLTMIVLGVLNASMAQAIIESASKILDISSEMSLIIGGLVFSGHVVLAALIIHVANRIIENIHTSRGEV